MWLDIDTNDLSLESIVNVFTSYLRNIGDSDNTN